MRTSAYTALGSASHPFTSLRFTSLPFASLHFTSLRFASLPFVRPHFGFDPHLHLHLLSVALFNGFNGFNGLNGFNGFSDDREDGDGTVVTSVDNSSNAYAAGVRIGMRLERLQYRTAAALKKARDRKKKPEVNVVGLCGLKVTRAVAKIGIVRKEACPEAGDNLKADPVDSNKRGQVRGVATGSGGYCSTITPTP